MPTDINDILAQTREEIEVIFEEFKRSGSLRAIVSLNHHFPVLLKAAILKHLDSSLVLNYEYPTCIVISSFILGDFELKSSVTSFEESIFTVKKVMERLKHHGVTSDTAQFRTHLLKDLIIYSNFSGNDVTDRILTLEKDSRHVYELSSPLALAIPQLRLPLQDLYKLYVHLYSLTYDTGGPQEVFLSLQAFAKAQGKEVLDLALKDDNKLAGFVANILVGLYDRDKISGWQELQGLSKSGYELETLHALANIKIDNVDDAIMVFSHLKSSYTMSEETSSWLAWAYANIINCAHTTEEYRRASLDVLRDFSSSKNERINSEVIAIANQLKVSEATKFEIISNVDVANPALLARLAYVIKDFNLAHFFGIIRKAALAQKLDFKTEELQYYLQQKRKAFPTEFSKQLAAMLADRLGFVRFAGSKILQEIHNQHDPFSFAINLLCLPEHHQIRIINSIVLDFMHPADVIRFILPFRNSSSKAVLQTLVDSLAAIMEDYHHDTIVILRQELPSPDDTGEQLLKIFEQYHTDLSKIITQKNSLEEFNPHKNQARSLDHFFRLSKRKMQEQFNEGQAKNSIFASVHKVSIARGKSWKMERSDHEPSPLSLISTAITYPRMCLMNPDEYNWEFIVRVNSDYKNA